MFLFIIIFSAFAIVPVSAYAKATDTGPHYVVAKELHERLAPNKNGKVTNKIHRQQRVEVFEIQNGWARVSRYYDGKVEGVPGRVARWVAAAYLSKDRPPDLAQTQMLSDPRIQGIPKVGEYGLTKKDVAILYRGAQQLLKSGRCDHIEYGDKSVKKPGTYYVNCGGSRNISFKPADLGQPNMSGDKSPEIGRTLFNGKGICLACHGRDGHSDQIPASSIALVNKLDPPPTDVRTSPVLKKKTDEEIFRVIKFGKPGTAMVSMTQVNDQEIWHLVSYLRTINTP